ncbi:uncharacterized protein LOC134844824 [Symsagittifera roscoffensis]|uniref:uncharacterized protein LOC134844824 n=1 Tax=Symsagittifera roscoffensis TaxID=84072 RepID=UPI00307C7366
MKLLFDFGCIFCVTFSLTFELLSSTRTWYASDERKIYEWSIVPTRQRTIFDIRTSISGKNGNICCLAVNYQIGNQVFVSDTGENKILRLDIESDWALDQPIKVQKEIVRDRVAHSLVYDDTNDFLYFATIDFIWRARKDGTSLISLRKIMPHFKVLSMEFNVKKSELLWSSWNEHDKTGKLTTSHVPELTCTKDIFEGNSKLESMFLFSPDKLYAVDSINMKIVSFDVNTTQLVASKRSREEFSEVHGGDAAKGLFVHSESKMIYLNEKSRELVFCAHSGCSFLNFFSTEFTPSDIKLNLSRQIAGKHELLWSSWNEHDKTGKLTTSHVPELTCTKDIFEGNSKLESMFLFSPDKLYAVDSINMKIVSFDVNTTQLVASKRSREEFSEVHGGDAAKGLFVHSESKMIYLNEKSRELVFCAHSGCSFLNFFSTEFTPSDIKLNLSRQIAADAIKYQPKLISAHQTYYFPDSVVFDFDTDANQVSKDYPPRFAKFQYQASIQLLQGK